MKIDENTDFRGLLEAAPDAIAIVRANGRIAFVNRQAERVFGYEREELLEQPLELLMPERFRRRHVEYRDHYFAAPKTRPMGAGVELFGLRKDGSEFPVDIMLSPWASAGEDFVIAVIRDITERKQAAEEARKVNQTLTTLFEAAPDAIMTTDAHGVILRANSQAGQLFGYGTDELVGKRVESLMPERFRHAHHHHRDRYMGEPRLREMGAGLELFGVRKDGSEFPVDIMLSPIDTAEGKGVIAIIRDVTERKRAEEILKRSHDILEQRVLERTAELTRANAVLRAEADRLAAIIKTQHDVSALGHDLQAILGMIAERTQSLTHAAGVSIELLENGELVCRVATGLGARLENLCLGNGERLSQQCLRAGKVLHCEDAENDARMNRSVCLEAGVRSIVALPLREGVANVGVLKAFSEMPQAFSERDVRVFELLAGLTIAAMSNVAKLRADQELLAERSKAVAALETRAQLQAAVTELSQHALEGKDLATLLDDAVALVPQILGVEFSKIVEVQPDGRLLLRAGAGWNEGVVGETVLPSSRHSQAGYTLLHNAPVIVEDFRTETRFDWPPLLRAHGVLSGITAPIHGRGGPHGVLGAHSSVPRRFTSDDVHFVQSVTSVLAAAIERRRLEEELLDISGREQRRIGQDLHDGLCQHLAGIQFVSELIAEELPPDLAAKQKVAKIAGDIRQAILQTRMLARGLSPVELEANGLMSALQELASNTEKIFKLECRFECPRPVLIRDNAAATHLFRIAQEAIHNAIKHSEATRIHLGLSDSGDECILRIVDNGTGIPPEARHSRGMGLRIMNYRAEMIGGMLRIHPAESQGTEVVCIFKQ